MNMNIDGVPLFESSNYNAVPILCKINEAHPMQRRENVMLTALWCGKHKPPMKAYLQPFIEEACVLNEKGFKYSYEGKNYIKTCKIILGIFNSIA